jgi:hypothetical protein
MKSYDNVESQLSNLTLADLLRMTGMDTDVAHALRSHGEILSLILSHGWSYDCATTALVWCLAKQVTVARSQLLSSMEINVSKIGLPLLTILTSSWNGRFKVLELLTSYGLLKTLLSEQETL